MSKTMEYSTLGGGCFWCIQAVFDQVPGVLETTVGYAGGRTQDPNYEQVCGGDTGHAEVVQIAFDPERIDFSQILDYFWRAHDPTTKDRQGADMGPQYRSIILTHNDEQRRIARESIDSLNRSKKFNRPIVTEIQVLDKFYPAEDYHQKYFEKHPYAGYCSFVIRPKLKKLGMQ